MSGGLPPPLFIRGSPTIRERRVMSNLASTDVSSDFGTSVSPEREDSCGSTHTLIQSIEFYLNSILCRDVSKGAVE